MKKAWIENNQVRDICQGNPVELYHPDVAKFYDVDVPDDAVNGDGWVDGQLVKPVTPVPVEPPSPVVVPPKVSPVEFKLLFTPQERVAIKAARANDPILDDFYDIVEDPRLTHVDLGLASTQAALDYLTAMGLIAAGRKDVILAGQVQ
jgi:hypothetical protein